MVQLGRNYMLFLDLFHFVTIDARAVIVFALLDRVYQVDFDFRDNAYLLCGWTLILGRDAEAMIICLFLMCRGLEHCTVHYHWGRTA